MADQIGLLERAMDTTGRLVDGVRPEQLDDSTPCSDWRVRDLLNHIVSTSLMFGECAAGGSSEYNPFGDPPELIGDDPQGAYKHAREVALEGWRTPGALDGTVQLPVGDSPGKAAIMIHIADNVTHGWDLARATGQPYAPDPDVVEAAFGAVNGRMSDESRGPGKPFAAEVQVADDAPTLDRLAAYLGRQP